MSQRPDNDSSLDYEKAAEACIEPNSTERDEKAWRRHDKDPAQLKCKRLGNHWETKGEGTGAIVDDPRSCAFVTKYPSGSQCDPCTRRAETGGAGLTSKELWKPEMTKGEGTGAIVDDPRSCAFVTKYPSGSQCDPSVRRVSVCDDKMEDGEQPTSAEGPVHPDCVNKCPAGTLLQHEPK